MGYKKIRVTSVTLVVDRLNCLVENTRLSLSLLYRKFINKSTKQVEIYNYKKEW